MSAGLAANPPVSMRVIRLADRTIVRALTVVHLAGKACVQCDDAQWATPAGKMIPVGRVDVQRDLPTGDPLVSHLIHFDAVAVFAHRACEGLL